jgi:hypothetical protein
MRVPVLVYVLLYLVLEMIGAQLAAVEWRHITPLMVASAVTDAMLVVAVLVAVLVTADLTKHRWRPAVRTWVHERTRPRAGWWDQRRYADPDAAEGQVLGVRSWRPARPERPALPAGSPAAVPTATYAAPTYAAGGTPPRPGRPFPEDDGRLF